MGMRWKLGKASKAKRLSFKSAHKGNKDSEIATTQASGQKDSSAISKNKEIMDKSNEVSTVNGFTCLGILHKTGAHGCLNTRIAATLKTGMLQKRSSFQKCVGLFYIQDLLM